MLDRESFIAVVAATPLVSIDLIVPDGHGRYLVGRRTNRPAQGYWFVPGGRIRKGERLDAAFCRLASGELGIHGARRADSVLLGVYEHLYDDNFADAVGVSTHYVVLSYRLPAGAMELAELPYEQHTDYRWLTPAQALDDEWVHENTKAYFR